MTYDYLKMIMNKNSSNNNEAIDRIEFKSEATRFDKDAQYFVTLKIRIRRTLRKTDMPSGSKTSEEVRFNSTIEPQTTKQSNRLNNDTKYGWRPNAYIFRNISAVNKPSKILFATT